MYNNLFSKTFRRSAKMVGHTYIDDFKTLPEMLAHTLATKPEKEGYRYYDYEHEKWTSVTWKEFGERVMRWRKAFATMGLKRGDRVAMLLINSLDALTFDQAALANALVPVPLHAIDTPESAAYIMSDSGCRFLVTTTKARWNAIFNSDTPVPTLEQVVFTTEEEEGESKTVHYCGVNKWLKAGETFDVNQLPAGPTEEDLAAIVYTSGTTGRPKGVMLTHRAVVSNVQDTAKQMPLSDEDLFLSYLPLSHTFERTATYYNCVAHGATLVFSRGPMQLAEDFKDIHPTIMCSVPRILEQFYAKIQAQYARQGASAQLMADRVVAAGWRDFCRANDLPLEDDGLPALDSIIKALYFDRVAAPMRALFGPRFKYIISGGAALNGMVAKFFCALGLNIRQAYGLTEYSPIISMNGITGNHPATVGLPLARCQVRAGDNEELQVFGPSMMKGYWNLPKETAASFTEDGWLRTGDQVDLSDGGRVRIKGRIKEIIVTSTGEKISPVDVEFAIQEDHLFEQVMVVGEGRPYITALVVVNDMLFKLLCEEVGITPDSPALNLCRDLRAKVVKRVRMAARHFPQYCVPRNVYIMREHWTAEDGLLTPTMKLRRRQIAERFAKEIEELYDSPRKR